MDKKRPANKSPHRRSNQKWTQLKQIQYQQPMDQVNLRMKERLQIPKEPVEETLAKVMQP